MTRDEFDEAVYDSLIEMGDTESALTMDDNVDFWDDSYDCHKHKSLAEFKRYCLKGVEHYRKAKKGLLN